MKHAPIYIHTAHTSRLPYMCLRCQPDDPTQGNPDHVTHCALNIVCQVLLVFGKDDAQCDAIWWATKRGNYHCHISRNVKDALDTYIDQQFDLVIIDTRMPKLVDAEQLCRYVRAIS